MPYTRAQIDEIARLYKKIEDNKEHEYSAPTYKDSPALIRMAELALSCDDTDAETLENKMIIFSYLASSYDAMCRQGISVKYHKLLIEIYSVLPSLTEKQRKELENEMFCAFKARNRYAQDDCADIVELIKGKMRDDELLKMLEDAKTSAKNCIKNDPCEGGDKYLSVIDEVEREIDEILSDHGRGMGFCHIYWSTKSECLQKRGIYWRSPVIMNPKVRFD